MNVPSHYASKMEENWLCYVIEVRTHHSEHEPMILSRFVRLLCVNHTDTLDSMNQIEKKKINKIPIKTQKEIKKKNRRRENTQHKLVKHLLSQRITSFLCVICLYSCIRSIGSVQLCSTVRQREKLFLCSSFALFFNISFHVFFFIARMVHLLENALLLLSKSMHKHMMWCEQKPSWIKDEWKIRK